MRIKILSALFLIPGIASAAPITETWIAPGGGINATQSKVVAPGTTLNGKSLLDAMSQIDANTTAASAAQTTANTGVTNAATAQSAAEAAQTTASSAIPLTQKGAASGVAELDSNSNIALPTGKSVAFGGDSYFYHNTSGWLFQDASETLSLSDINTASLQAAFGGIDPVSAYQTQSTKSIEVQDPTDTSVGRQFTLWGGHSANDINAIKASCQNVSGGDEGGVCYQFSTGYGPEYDRRSGSGDTDGVNVEMDSSSAAPLDVIGGGATSADGVVYSVSFGSNTATITPALSEKEKKIFRSRISVFTNVANGMSTTESNDYSGTDNVDIPNYYHGYMSSLEDSSDGSSTLLTVESYYYPGAQFPGTIQGQYEWRTQNVPSPYPYPGEGSWTQTTSSSASSGATSITISGSITPPEAGGSSSNACNVWTCGVSGTGIPEGTTVLSTSASGSNTVLKLSSAITEDISSATTISLSVSDSSGGTNYAPGAMSGDSFDNKITYTSPITGDTVGNTNYHSYSSNALFIGQSGKDFNEYHLQADYQPTNSITRAHDNEYDFWMKGADHDGQLESRGLTLVWQGSKRLATGSYMMRLAGFNIQPTGLYVDGVMNSGMEFRSDTGLFAFKQVGKESSTVGTYTPSMLMGSVGSSSGFGQLGWFASEDGSSNGSYHLGLTKSADTLQYNVDPLCKSTDVQPNPSWSCSVSGQLVFDPNGYAGGISLSTGQGSSAKNGLVVDSNANVTVPNSLSVSGEADFSSDLHTGEGKSIYLTDSSSNAAAYIYANSSGQMNVSFSSGSSASKQMTVNGAIEATGTLTAGTIIIPFGTPASSTATCTKGQLEMDATYLYSCVSTNTWSRTANGATW